MVISALDMLLRMGAGVVLGASIGYERERSGRPAGLRTHLLVSLASDVFMLVSTQFVYFQSYGKDDLITVDTSRIAASVVTGVGFLGAGAILRTGVGVHGLTTAASLWLVSAIGLAAGGGMYLVALSATVISLIVLTLMRRVEAKQWSASQRHIVLTVESEKLTRSALSDFLKAKDLNVTEIDYGLDASTNKSRFKFNVELKDESALEQMIARLESLPGILRVKVQRRSGAAA